MVCNTDHNAGDRQYRHLFYYECVPTVIILQTSYKAVISLTQFNSTSTCHCFIQLMNDVKLSYYYKRTYRKWQSYKEKLSAMLLLFNVLPELLNFLSGYCKKVFHNSVFLWKPLSCYRGTDYRSLSCGEAKAARALIFYIAYTECLTDPLLISSYI
jgi:hypothetical protein